MKNRVHKKFSNKYWSNNQVIVSTAVGILAFVIMMLTLFSYPKAGVIDYGEYAQTMADMGLSYTEEMTNQSKMLQFKTTVENFEIDSIKVLSLLQLTPSKSLIYPVSIVSIFCKVFDIPFSTHYLAFLLGMVVVYCIYSMTKSLYAVLGEKAAFTGILSCFIFLCGDKIIYFNSLYDQGIFFVGILLYFNEALKIIVEKKKGYRSVFLLLFYSLLILNSKPVMIILLPFILIINGILFFYCRPQRNRQIAYFAIVSICSVLLVCVNTSFVENDTAFHSNTQLYHSFYTGVLKVCNNQEQLLDELGLPAETKADIGKTAYLSDDSYCLSPNSKEAQKAIFDQLSYQNLLGIYERHPATFVSVLKSTSEQVERIDTTRFLYENRNLSEGTEWVERFNIWSSVRTILTGNSLFSYIGLLIVSILILGFAFFIQRGKEEKRILWLSMIPLSFSVALFCMLFLILGFAEADTMAYYFIVSFDLLLLINISTCFSVVCTLLKAIRKKEQEVGIITQDEALIKIEKEQIRQYNQVFLSETLNENESLPLMDKEKEEIQETKEDLFVKNPFISGMKNMFGRIHRLINEKILDYPTRAGILIAVIAAIIIFGVLFFQGRIGAYNNGDFGRMMSAMNLKYTAKDWENSDELSLTKVVEKYDWETPYDYSKIMPYNADLTQIWFSIPLKLIDNYVGLQFSTVYVTIMYACLIIISIFFIMQVLFHRLGRRTFPFAIVLLFILLDLVNLGWLNSLYGEGIAFVALLMLIASAMKTADMKRGSCRWSFVFLFISEIIFIGAKAQYTLTVPICIILDLILFIYHCPKKIWKKIPYFLCLVLGAMWLTVSAFHIYKNNEKISSPDATYMSMFYGLLMIVDDPQATLQEFGLDERMSEDIGKHAFMDKSKYYCAPRTQKAEEMFYSKVNTMDVLKYYLQHPKLLLTILEDTAEASAEAMPDFVIKVGQKTTQEHDKITRFNLWGIIRPYVACSHFWQLVVLYLLEIIISLCFFINKKKSIQDKVLLCVLLAVSAIGIMQYPLTIIGNGFADNTKQLFIFRVTLDITIFTALFLLYPRVILISRQVGEKYDAFCKKRRTKKNEKKKT